ncbi:tyrosine-type recombinase/integrase [Streptomyces sp. NPDC058985]|uniref:tyrosine-type recombinase/integrase n=1 Tax=Streptomyces sp. NPDC058985 TaxID=3346684 RepID=UPI0036BC5372
MSRILRLPAPDAAVPGRSDWDSRAWLVWLHDRFDGSWRPGEWDGLRWLFTGDLTNPRTSSSTCRTRACDTIVNTKKTFCSPCAEQLRASHQDPDAFAAAYRPVRQRSFPGMVTVRCSITRDGVQCVRPRHCKGMCVTHYGAWKYHATKGTEEAWLRDRSQPFTDDLPCQVSACPSPSYNSRGLCNYHARQWSKDNRRNPLDAEQWAVQQSPYLATHQFSLLPLPELLRHEMLYGLQQTDLWIRALEPHRIRNLVRDLSGAATLLAEDTGPDRLASAHAGAVRTLQRLRTAVRSGFEEFSCQPLAEPDVLDLRTIGLRTTAGGAPRRMPGTADLRPIHQPWLRDLIRHWATTSTPRTEVFSNTLRAVTIASRTLAQRPGQGLDPAALHFTDASAIVDAFRVALRRDGTLYRSSQRRTLVGCFFQLIDYGRRSGQLNTLAGAFTRHPVEHRIRIEETDEDGIGKAVPETVIRQLDTHLDTLGLGEVQGRRDLPPADRQLLYQTVYILLRDTGRRPLEIAALPHHCLETTHGQTSLIWNNHKRHRHRRRLPITESTAQAIRTWQARRPHLPLPATNDAYLFPALSSHSSAGHLNANYISETLRAWVDSLPALHAEGVDASGNPLPFDRTLIYPYAFRHSYAQRHANAGTPVDVLRELMDHRSIAMTQRYYQVSLTRKRAAVATLSTHVVDRLGQPAPSTTASYELRSVAVPYGGCTEPSNVKAGGASCPIRFQCAGCGFYRPDPSYLPAIEQHINELRADRETAQAMDAATFVITALSDQITAFEQAVTRMKTRLAAMPAHERQEIEHASTLLRRARAASHHTLLPLTTTDPPQSPS